MGMEDPGILRKVYSAWYVRKIELRSRIFGSYLDIPSLSTSETIGIEVLVRRRRCLARHVFDTVRTNNKVSYVNKASQLAARSNEHFLGHEYIAGGGEDGVKLTNPAAMRESRSR